MNLSDINLFSIIYLAFRLGPFVMVSYFMIYSMFNRDFSSLIFLAGLLMACFIAILIGNSIPMSFLQLKPDSFCNVIRLGTGEPISKLPLSIVTFVYTFAYFSVPIYKNDTQSENIWFLVLFPVLILFDMIWLYIYGCAGLFTMVAAGAAGIAVALSWGEIVYSLDLQVPKSNQHENQSLVSSTDPSRYICLKGVESFVPRTLQEGFGIESSNMPTDGSGISCGSDPNGAPKHASYRFMNGKLHVYPNSTIFSSWDPTMKTTTVADCTDLPLGENMELNPDSAHSTHGENYTPKPSNQPDWYHPATATSSSTSSSNATATATAPSPSPSSTSSELYYSKSALSTQLHTIYQQWNQLQATLYSFVASNKIYEAAQTNITNFHLPAITTLLSSLNQMPNDKIQEPASVKFYASSFQKMITYTSNDLENITKIQKPQLDVNVVQNLSKQYTDILSNYKIILLPE